MKTSMWAYTHAIAKFFGITWLHAVVWLTEDEVRALAAEIRWLE